MELRRTKAISFTLQLAGLALCLTGLWLFLSPAEYQASVRIKLWEDTFGMTSGAASYDPYFIQTEYEVMQSQIVLGRVVDALDLKAACGKKFGDGSPLKTTAAIRQLRSHLQLEAIPNTRLIKISFTSDDPNEAARIANAIAQAYRDFRVERRRQQTVGGIQVLTEEYQKEEEQIRTAQTKANLLRQELNITNQVPPPQVLQALQPEQTNRNERHEAVRGQPYWEAEHQLEQLTAIHKLLAAKIEAEKLDLQIPKTSLVQIVDLAEPPKFPTSPNRRLGAALLFIGMPLNIGGGILLKSSNR